MTSSHSSEDDEKQEVTVDIAQDGDVVFIVGTNRRQLRVHSLLLTNASPVFRAMLGPSFKEGKQLAQFGLAEIELPEDDAEAIEIIFKVIHGRNDQVPEFLHNDKLFQVTTVAEKYGCLVPVSFALESWIDISGTTKSERLWTIAMVALATSRRKLFADATSELIRHHAGSYLDLTKVHPDFPLHLRTAGLSHLDMISPAMVHADTKVSHSNAGTGTE